MGTDLLKIKYDKLLYELKFVRADFEYHQSVIVDVQDEFSRLAVIEIKERGLYNKFFSPSKKLESKNIKEKISTRKESKDLYKKIVNVTHPDKLVAIPEPQRKEMEKKFLEARSAMDEDRLLSLYQIAQDVGVEIPQISDTHIALFEEEIQMTREEIIHLQKTWVWVWNETPHTKLKKEIISKYIDFLLTHGMP